MKRFLPQFESAQRAGLPLAIAVFAVLLTLCVGNRTAHAAVVVSSSRSAESLTMDDKSAESQSPTDEPERPYVGDRTPDEPGMGGPVSGDASGPTGAQFALRMVTLMVDRPAAQWLGAFEPFLLVPNPELLGMLRPPQQLAS
jgi:hypothetical protein